MKLISSYIRELKIASRGFYFYIEIAVAIVLLVILLVAIQEESSAVQEEFLLIEMDVTDGLTANLGTTGDDATLSEGDTTSKNPEDFASMLPYLADSSSEGQTIRLGEPKEWNLKPASFTITNRDTEQSHTYDFTSKESIITQSIETVDTSTNRVVQRAYLVPDTETLYRLAYQEKQIAAVISLDQQFNASYQYIMQGYETDRLIDTLYILHNEDTATLSHTIDQQQVLTLGATERLNNRENALPFFLAFAGSLMGFFIVVAYIFLDKAEGVIKAFAVSPASMTSYLVSKIMVICTTVLISSSIITIPVMGGRANYPLLYLFLLVSTYAFAALGLLVASYFETMNKSFGVLYGLMIALMIPAFSYAIPSFDPVWLRFFPTYPVLQVYKDLLLRTADTGYAWIYTGVFLAGGTVLLAWARHRFTKTLTA